MPDIESNMSEHYSLVCAYVELPELNVNDNSEP